MDPLQPLPRRPKKSTAGAWLLAIGLFALAAVVLWLNLRPRRMSLQQRVEQARDQGRELLSGDQSGAGATDPAVRSSAPQERREVRASDLPAPPTETGKRARAKSRKP